jgi:chorismate mutase-like protein
MSGILRCRRRQLQWVRWLVLGHSMFVWGCQPAPAVKESTVAPAPTLSAEEIERRLNRLEASVIGRLMLMPEVARAKFEASIPIYDPDRETAVTIDFLGQADAQRVPGWMAEHVIHGQLAASRAWQQLLFAEWAKSPPVEGPVRDLATELRPEIDRATAELVACLAEYPFGNTDALKALRGRVETGTRRPPAMPERIWWLAWEPFVGPRTPAGQRRITVQRDSARNLADQST